MKRPITFDFFCKSKKWNRRLTFIKKIFHKSMNEMVIYFDKNYFYNFNIILSNNNELANLNKKYKKKNFATDVLTFVNKIEHNKLGKIKYCDIFFSIDIIEKYINNKNIDFYDHFNHLAIHSLLHANGYQHSNNNDFKKMKNIEIKIMNKLGRPNPYLSYE